MRWDNSPPGLRLIKIVATTIIILGILGYAAFELSDIVTGPSIEISSPHNGETLHETMISIEGRANHISELSINNRKTLMDEAGFFKEALLLSSGLNVVLIQGKDRFGRSVESKLQLIYK